MRAGFSRPVLEESLSLLKRPVDLLRAYDRADLRPDLVAGLTVAVVLLPQAIAYALIADLPPVMGLYGGIVAAVVGGLWGSSNHLQTGPTNTIALLVLGALALSPDTDPEQMIVLAGVLAVMVGFFQLVLGLARLGLLINFVSHSVVVGFAAGAAVLIAVRQLRHLLGLDIAAHNMLQTLLDVGVGLPETHLTSLYLGAGTIAFILLFGRVAPRFPGTLAGMVGAAIVVGVFGLDGKGVQVLGELPRSLPPLANLTFDLEVLGQLSTGALAVASVGLVEAMSIGRSIASRSGQRLDSNQEFVGQGLSNIVSGIFSGFPGAGSFSRSAVNYRAGARTPVAGIFTGLIVLIAVLALGPLAVYVPRTALAGVLILTAYRMIDRAEIARIWRGARADAMIMLVTFLGTLFLHLEFAVLMGILISFAVYILKTSVPHVVSVLPDESFQHFIPHPQAPPCPQLELMDINGDLYFGAVSHIEEAILKHLEENPRQRYLLLRMHSVNNCDFSGIHALETIIRAYRERRGDVYMVRVKGEVYELMKSTGLCDYLGEDHFLSEESAIPHLFYKVLDPAICIYECDVRAFRECQNLPKRHVEVHIPPVLAYVAEDIDGISPLSLWEDISGGTAPRIIDVREPREFHRGHIPQAELIPLPKLVSQQPHFRKEAGVVVVCRSGRRSRQAARYLVSSGIKNVRVLEGGILGWESAGLLEAIDRNRR